MSRVNASTISLKKKRNSSGDTSAVHPYVVEEKERLKALKETATWETATIIRDKRTTAPIKIIRQTKKEKKNNV